MSRIDDHAEEQLPPLDSEVAAILEEMPVEYKPKNLIDFDDLPASRERMAELYENSVGDAQLSDTVETEDITIPGPSQGQKIRLRIHRPAEVTGQLPCVYWIHGGGMVSGRVETDDVTVQRFVDNLDCVVIAVDYRLSPEHPYPAPVDDCYTGLTWVADNAEELSVDDSRIAIAGQSAGGGLAAATGLRARDEGAPELCFQMLLCPMLDDRNITESSKQITDIGIWDREMNIQGWEAFLGELSGEDELPPYASPGRVEDLSGLPPTFLDVGTHEVFRDETTAFADRAAKCGVQTEYHLYPGCYHGYDHFAPDAKISGETWTTRIDALQRAFTE